MKDIKFSVLIPVYNVENYVAECINSVLSQSYKNFEIILINDGSTDSSGEICDKFAEVDARISVYHQENKGLIMARRYAISKASGDYYLFLDSDDYWDNNLLEIIYNTILEFNCDLIIFNYKKVSDKGDILTKGESLFKDKTVFDNSNKRQLFELFINSTKLNNLWIKVVKSSIVDSTDYYKYKNVKNAEDLLQSIPLVYNAKKIVYIDKALYNYRMNPNSITHTININSINDVTIARSVLLEYLQKLKIDNEYNIKLFYSFYIKSVANYIVDLLNSDIMWIEKKNILFNINNIELYSKALKIIDILILPFRQKLVIKLFYNKRYKLLYLYCKTVNFIKCIMRLIRREHL